MTNQTVKLTKVKKSCATAKKVLKVLKILLMVGIICSMVGAVICFALHDKIDSAMAQAVAAGTVTIDYEDFNIGGIIRMEGEAQQAIEAGYYAYVFGACCIAGAIVTAFSKLIVNKFYQIFEIIETSETPFSEDVTGKLRKVFIVLVVLVALFVDPGVALFMGLAFWCVYTIMDYGIALQQEVDETL